MLVDSSAPSCCSVSQPYRLRKHLRPLHRRRTPRLPLSPCLPFPPHTVSSSPTSIPPLSPATISTSTPTASGKPTPRFPPTAPASAPSPCSPTWSTPACSRSSPMPQSQAPYPKHPAPLQRPTSDASPTSTVPTPTRLRSNLAVWRRSSHSLPPSARLSPPATF